MRQAFRRQAQRRGDLSRLLENREACGERKVDHEKVLAGVVVAVFGILPWLAGMGNTVVHAAAGDSRKGKAIYEKSCVLCHGPQGRGDGPVGKTINPPAADFTSAASKKKTDAELLATIENGRPPTAMVGWKGQLSEAEIQDVLAYVKSLRQ